MLMSTGVDIFWWIYAYCVYWRRYIARYILGYISVLFVDMPVVSTCVDILRDIY